ncbi:hypothetical protein [Burkholderia latens]|uniref:Uncharacterized protein n=1 Tax=Burkholderia latens TaxID=488446 RepID=A0A6H9SQ48_9BURK|nr:hypothetical protein [Burkholderia latens]KAB0631277.1 hypothetical protein F7R21_32075 [Burkholderia latens]
MTAQSMLKMRRDASFVRVSPRRFASVPALAASAAGLRDTCMKPKRVRGDAAHVDMLMLAASTGMAREL